MKQKFVYELEVYLVVRVNSFFSQCGEIIRLNVEIKKITRLNFLFDVRTIAIDICYNSFIYFLSFLSLSLSLNANKCEREKE